MADLLVLVQDLATAGCAGFNAVYFFVYWLRGSVSAPRRVGAAALALINAAIVVESLFFLALYWTHQWRGSVDIFLSPSVWLSARLLLLLGTAFISVLILRQQRRC